MADDNHRIGEIQQEVFQPADGLNIQVVGRLVQQQDIRAAEQRLRQQNLDLLTAVQFAHQHMLHIQADAQTGEDHLRVAFGLPAIQLGELTLQLAGTFAVFIGEVLLGIEFVLFTHDLIEAAVAHDDSLQNLEIIKLEMVLAKDSHALAGGDHNIAGRRFQFAGEDLEERGFSGSVGADDAVAVAGGKLDIDILKEGLAAIGKRYILRCNHGAQVLLFTA